MIGKILPRLILTGLSLAVVIFGVYATKKGPSEVLEGSVLSKKTESPTTTPTATAVVTATPSSQLQTNNMSDWIYPGSAILASGDSGLTLSSGDNPNAITDWYKNKIKSTGANVTSFVTTNTNDEVLNKLVGASSDFEIRIEIAKTPSESLTKITITQT